MNIAQNKKFWISLAAGAACGAFLFSMRRKSHHRTGAPRGTTRVLEDPARLVAWRFDHQFRTLPAGNALRIEVESPAVVHWTVNQWDSVEDTRTTEIALGVHVVDLATEDLKPGTRVQFTFYWPGVNRWEGEDFDLRIEPATSAMARTAQAKSD